MSAAAVNPQRAPRTPICSGAAGVRKIPSAVPMKNPPTLPTATLLPLRGWLPRTVATYSNGIASVSRSPANSSARAVSRARRRCRSARRGCTAAQLHFNICTFEQHVQSCKGSTVELVAMDYHVRRAATSHQDGSNNAHKDIRQLSCKSAMVHTFSKLGFCVVGYVSLHSTFRWQSYLRGHCSSISELTPAADTAYEASSACSDGSTDCIEQRATTS